MAVFDAEASTAAEQVNLASLLRRIARSNEKGPATRGLPCMTAEDPVRDQAAGGASGAGAGALRLPRPKRADSSCRRLSRPAPLPATFSTA